MEEKDLEIIKKGLTFVERDTHSDVQHWYVEYLGALEPPSLPNK